MYLADKKLSGQMAYKITILGYFWLLEANQEFGPYLNTENIEIRKWAKNFVVFLKAPNSPFRFYTFFQVKLTRYFFSIDTC